VALRASCKGLLAIVAVMRADLGTQPARYLKEMLTCFPKANTIILREDHPMTQEEQDSLIVWLKETGNSLISVHYHQPLEQFVRCAWRAGVFKTVKSVSLSLPDEDNRALVIDGSVSGVESIQVELSEEAPEVERAALGYLRTFPALKEITCRIKGDCSGLPPFIPPSLEGFTLDTQDCSEVDLLLEYLPSMIETSGAKLRDFALFLNALDSGDAARNVDSLLRSCASTLSRVDLHSIEPFGSAVEVAEGLASCQHIERVIAPIDTFAVVPPNGSFTFRLVHLHLIPSYWDVDYGQSLSDVELSGLMARGGFPILESLSLKYGGWEWGADLGPALLAAFEGVAGTLTALTLSQGDSEGALIAATAFDVQQHLGEAIGKLRRLETLEFDCSGQGVAYHQLALALHEGACPALRSFTCRIERGDAWLACQPSLIRPSVQNLRICFGVDRDSGEGLALAVL
jgi:hypothetical protein